uniref:Putative zinc finger, CCHC-type n=1 Tax=Tanacetum cinerariifolium TaxID=118510 RepID=A0A6L2KUC4_TANCI|nr:putative zinc finger, CCHC-type [Tanacetum cinerariifolium]
MITNSQEYLLSRVRYLESIINELRFKIQELHLEIIQIIRTSPTTQHSSSISQKEAEIKNLKNQLQDLEWQHKQKRITSLIDDPWRLPSTPFVGVSFDPQLLPQSYTHTTSPSLNIWASEQRRLKPPARKEPTFFQESQSIADVVTSTKTLDVLPIQKVNPVSMLQGRLRDWYPNLGEYHQLQIQQSISPEAFMSIIYSEFIGSPWEHTTHAKEEFLKMKCCSFQKKDSEKHYDRISQRFYYLNGVDDVNLKQVFLNSFPESLGNEAYRALEARNALNQVEPVDVSDLESLYSLDDKRSDSVLCTIVYSDLSSDDDSDTDSLESDYDFGVHMINPILHVLPIQEDPPLPLAKIHLFTNAYAKPIPVIAFFDTDPPLPLAKIHLFTNAYAKPIPVIAFFDTGSSVSILNHNILLNHYWKPHNQNFMAANGEKFVIDKISVPINIRLFPKYVIKRMLLGSSSHGKDLLIGFDILYKLPNLRWTDARVLSKFDLKSGFWQLGVKPEDPLFTTPHIALFMIGTMLTHPAEETSDDARSLWSSDNDEHFDPFEDDPTHPDARWSP